VALRGVLVSTYNTDDLLDKDVLEANEFLFPGDVVVLMSGGTPMTLGPETSPGTHICYWFDEMGNLRTATLPLVVLGHLEDED
jgi:uncharacterized protein YodC (DUF2158 family)